jgi:hypothetical protein
VPIKAGTRVESRVHPLHVEIWHAGRRIVWRDDQDQKMRQSGLESAVAANDD